MRNRQKKSRGRTLAVKLIPSPPTMIASTRVSRTQRYTVASAGTYLINRAALLQSDLICTAANTFWSIVSDIKVKRVKIWDTPTAVGGISTCSLQWMSFSGPRPVVSDTSIGDAKPLYVTATPPKESLANQWSGATSTQNSEVLFEFTCSANAVVDIEVDIIYHNGFEDSTGGYGPYTLTTVGAVGSVYRIYLEGVGAGSLCIPVAFPAAH